MVCLLAPDGAGKSTLAAGLIERLPFPVETIHMELYARGRSGRGVPGARFAARIGRQWQRHLRGRATARGGGLAVFDRYTYDALLPTGKPPRARDRVVRGTIARAIPPPDLAFILDAPAQTLVARKAEHSLETIERMRRGYLALDGRLPCPVEVIDVTRGADEVRRAVTERIWRALVER